jgi:hypothetical protein
MSLFHRLMATALAGLGASQTWAQYSESPTNQRLDKIRSSMQRSHKLSPDDRRFLLKTLDDKTPGITSVIAGLALVMAYDQHLLSRADLLTHIEKKLENTEPAQSILYWRTYVGVSGLGIVDGTVERSMNKLRRQREPATNIEPDERKFMSTCLADRFAVNQATAGQVLVEKQRLDPQSRRWAQSLLDSQIAKAKGDLKAYWQMVRRVMAFRNTRLN